MIYNGGKQMVGRDRQRINKYDARRMVETRHEESLPNTKKPEDLPHIVPEAVPQIMPEAFPSLLGRGRVGTPAEM